MPTVTTTTVDTGAVIALHHEEFRDELLTFAGAGTVLKGTLLARTTATGKLTPFVVGGAGGAGVAVALLTYDVVATGAGDIAVRALVRGVVNKNRLIIHADGNGVNITNAILDGLRDYGITPVDVALLS